MLSGCKEPPGKGQLLIVIKLKHISAPRHGTILSAEETALRVFPAAAAQFHRNGCFEPFYGSLPLLPCGSPRERAGAFCRERADLPRFPGM